MNPSQRALSTAKEIISRGPATYENAERIAEIIDLADHDALDLSRSRAVEQQVLDLLDGSPA